MLEKQKKRNRRHKRVRAKIHGTAARPRLCVFRSNKHIYAQLIDDENMKTLAAASDLELKEKKVSKDAKPQTKNLKNEEKGEKRTKNIDIAHEVGRLLAQKSLTKKIEKVIFDRGGYKYHGIIKSLAEGARAGGLKF
jgi:large subunit ribosomal protein L18